MTPVTVRGQDVVEVSSGRVVAHAKSKRNAHIIASIKNRAYREKRKRGKKHA